MDTMLAAVVDKNGALSVRAVPVPAFGPYQALVKMRFGATCAGTDLRLMQKKHPYPVSYPAVLGHESVGRVIETGERVRSFHRGDLISRVGMPAMPEIGLGICWGGFCEYGVATDWAAMEADGVPRTEWERARVQKWIPEDVPEAAAPMIITWRETLSYANRLGIERGRNVLIVGSGANALAFVCHAVYAGARVVTVGSASRAEDMLRLGSERNIDYHSEQVALQLAEAYPNGVDYIIDAVGAPDDVNAALPFLKEGGTIGVYGWHERQNYGINPFLAKKSFHIYANGYDEPETHDEVLRRIREGALDASVWYDICQPVPFKDIASAYEGLRAKKAYKYLIDLR
ncbi:MAG: zinc-binding dehydrogenase [Clostridiaceae bacterium]|nr:zinc-binding dehydrogenase [Eubacteriales bacterium]